jgi:hypothetical protein
VLDGAEGVVDLRAELPLDPFAAAQPVAMLAAIGALVLPHQGGGFLGNGAHLAGAVAAHVEDRAHMQGADRGVGIPGAARAVLREDLGQRVGVIGQMLERHGAILDEADRLAVALQAHHDVEAGLADLPQVLLARVVGHLDHAARQAEIAHQLDELAQFRQQWVFLLAGEFDQQDSGRLADQRRLDGRAEGRIGEAQLDHGAVDQFDGGRPESHDMLGGFHRRAESREIDDPEHLRLRQFRQLQGQRTGIGQGALGADQQVGEVDAVVGGIGLFALIIENVEIVAGDAAHHARPVRLDLGAVLRGEVLHKGGDGAAARAEPGHRAEIDPFAIGQPGADALHVMHHVAVGDGARAARVIPGHSAQRRLRAGRDVDRIPQAMLLQFGIQMVEHEAGFDGDEASLKIQFANVAIVFAVVDHEGGAGGLAALAGAAAARQHRNLHVAGDVERGGDVAFAFRHQHADGHDLVDRGIGRIPAARHGVEQHLAFRLRPEAPGQQLAHLVGRGAGGGGADGGSGGGHGFLTSGWRPDRSRRRASGR